LRAFSISYCAAGVVENHAKIHKNIVNVFIYFLCFSFLMFYCVLLSVSFPLKTDFLVGAALLFNFFARWSQSRKLPPAHRNRLMVFMPFVCVRNATGK